MEQRYQIDTAENKKFLEDIRNRLLDFGRKFPSPGGSAYYLGDDGTPWKEYARETYTTGRMAHVYTIGKYLGYPGSEELVKAAIKGLCGELRDKEYGGWYSGLNEDGSIVPDKVCYAHAFVILAGAAGVLAEIDGAGELLKEALETYDRYFWNEEEGMSCDTWNTEFTVKSPYRGLNANMHTVEAFLAASDVTGDEKYRTRAGRIIDHVIGWAEESNWRIPEHYTETWKPDKECNKEKPDDPFKPYGATPGHGLEWGRLIVQWALSTYKNGEKEADKYINASEELFDRAIADGWYADGQPGIVYTTGWDGQPVVHDRMHWTLMEGINTAAVLYRVTGKQVYADRYAEFMKYMDEKVLDHKNGSCFSQMDRNNVLKETVWPGKPDVYHSLQATLIPYYIPDLSIAVSVKKGCIYQ